MRKKFAVVLMILCVLILASCAKDSVDETVPESSSLLENLVQSEQDNTDWAQYIIESGVFDEYCPNNALISFNVMASQYSIQAQPKDIPTIIAMKNSDGTWSAVRNYIVNKEFTYVKNQVEKHAELEIKLLGYPVQLDAIPCSLYVPNADPAQYTFTYDSEQKIIYKSGKDDEMKFAQDLQNKILSCCEETMIMLKKVDEEAHELLADILNKKGLGPVVWNKIEPSSPNNNENLVFESDELQLSEQQIEIVRSMFADHDLLKDYATKGPFVQMNSNMILIEAGAREMPTMIMRRQNGAWQMERYYYHRVDDIRYTKNNEKRSANFMSDYYANYEGNHQQNVLICRLETPMSEPTGYNFIFDEAQQLFVDENGDSITFTKELHEQLLKLCNDQVQQNRNLDDALMMIAEEVIQMLNDGIKEKYALHETKYSFVTEGIDVYHGVKGIELQMDSEEIRKLNQKLAEEEREILALKDVGEGVENMADDNWRTIAFRDISTCYQQDILCLMIEDRVLRKEACGEGPNIQVYNIDIEEERLVSNREFLERLNIDPEWVISEVNESISERNCVVDEVPGCIDGLTLEDIDQWKITVVYDEYLIAVVRVSSETNPYDLIINLDW